MQLIAMHTYVLAISYQECDHIDITTGRGRLSDHSIRELKL